MIVLCDIDGTLANCDHRRKLLPNGKMDWAHFLHPSLVAKDTPIVPILNLVHALQEADHYVIFVTGRHSTLRGVTRKWLCDHYVMDEDDPEDILRMRGNSDFRPDYEVKEDMLREITLDMGGPPHLVIDDRPSVIAMWQRHSLFVLQVPSDMKD